MTSDPRNPADRVYTAIGLMSGTSLDGIDAALIRTDGRSRIEPLGFVTLPYDPDLRDELRDCLGRRDAPQGKVARASREITLAHADTVRELLAETGVDRGAVDVIGFHGQTLLHDPAQRFTWQIGDGPLLARELGIDVVCDFRAADVRAGGQGAPFLPLYHRARALAGALALPLAVLNVGGVANVTWIGPGDEDQMLAFDTGPGMALIDDFVRARTGHAFDRGGALATDGAVQGDILHKWLQDPYFARTPPKSLDRNAWNVSAVDVLAEKDAAATLVAFTAHAVARAQEHFPAPPARWLVTGGGRRNPVLMAQLAGVLRAPVDPVESVGWNGDALEAEGFGYLAVRSLQGLPLSLPQTTGVPAPMPGGMLCPKSAQA